MVLYHWENENDGLKNDACKKSGDMKEAEVRKNPLGPRKFLLTSFASMTLEHLWVLMALTLIALRPLLTPIPPHDFWWHMAFGRELVHHGTIPQQDKFSYTRFGEPFYNQSWLAQLLMYGLHELGGIPLVLVVQAMVIALAYGMLLWLCVLRSGMVRLSVIVLLLGIMPISFDNWNVRPQSYALPLFVAYFVILERWRWTAAVKRHYLWLLPLLMVVWVNIHGSFVLGGVLIAVTFIGELVQWSPLTNWLFRHFRGEADYPLSPPAFRRLLVWGGVTAVAVLVNPGGIAVLGYVRNLLSTSAVTTLVTEWAAPTIRDTNGKLFFGFLIFLGVVLAYSVRPPDVVDLLRVLVFLWLALGAGRNIIWFAIVAAPLLTEQIAGLIRSRNPPVTTPSLSAIGLSLPKQYPPGKSGIPSVNVALVGMLFLLLILGSPWVKPFLGLPPSLGALVARDTPVSAVEALRRDPARPRRLFHAMSYGSYLIWAIPDQLVFADPRIELYPREQWIDYIHLSGGLNVPQLLEKYHIDGFLLDNKEQSPLLDQVSRDPLWEVRYKDEQTTYLAQRPNQASPKQKTPGEEQID